MRALPSKDLLSSADTPYTLKNTGQGVQRVQPAPRTYKALKHVLRDVQAEVDEWIGSSMIHLGDHNVPNALNFIDKYNQVLTSVFCTLPLFSLVPSRDFLQC